jgi:hypothetical protein
MVLCPNRALYDVGVYLWSTINSEINKMLLSISLGENYENC